MVNEDIFGDTNYLDEEVENFLGEEPTSTPTKRERKNHGEKGNYKNDTFKTWWRNGAMMSIKLVKDKDLSKSRIMLNFMLGDPNNSNASQNTYISDSRTGFTMDPDEVFKFNDQLNRIYRAMAKNEKGPNIALVHEYNNEKKTLTVAQSEKKPSVAFVSLKKGNDRYSISMDFVEFKYFLFAIKMLMYEMYTGTRTGFTFNWI